MRHLRTAHVGRAVGRVNAWDPALHNGEQESEESMRERAKAEWFTTLDLQGCKQVGPLHIGRVELDNFGQLYLPLWSHAVEKHVPDRVCESITDDDFRSSGGVITWYDA